MIVGTRHICDRCGASIGNDFVQLFTEQPHVKEDTPYGWIAHYHPECYADVIHDIYDAARRMPEVAADSIETLNAIPVVHENVLRGLRSRHRLVNGKTPHEMEQERWSTAKVKWRRMSQAERDSLILDSLDGRALALWPLSAELNQRQDVIVTEATLRAHLKSMSARGLLTQSTEKPDRGRPRSVWSVCDAARVTS